MTTIHMETEKVRLVAKDLDAKGTQILSSLGQTQSAASRLRFAWQGGDADGFNNDLNQLIKKIESHVLALQSLSVQVSREVDEWIAVDSERPVGRWHDIVTLPERFKNQIDYLRHAKFLLGSAVVLSQVKYGKKAGEIIFSGSNQARHAADLSSQLRKASGAGIARNLVKDSKVTGLDLLAGGLEWADKGIEDWARYEDESDRAAALAYDGAFVAAKTALRPVAQNVVMTTVGVAALGALATAGAPAFLVVGAGLALWWGTGALFDWGADQLYKAADNAGIKDAFVHGAGDVIDQVASGVSSAAQAAAQTVDTGFKNVIQGISSWFR